MKAFSDRLQVDPQVWKPTKIGDSIEGILVDCEIKVSDFNPEIRYPVLRSPPTMEASSSGTRRKQERSSK
jgi:hypothetical protein